MTKKYVLVVGSGIHRQARVSTSKGPLASWDKLLSAITPETKPRVPDGRGSVPLSLEWERLVVAQAGRRATSKQPMGGAPYVTEGALRSRVAETIQRHVDAAEKKHIHRDVVAVVAHAAIGEIISLNFESSWHPLAAGKVQMQDLLCLGEHIKKPNRRQLVMRTVTSGGQRIWFPNGHYKKPETLRMGLRDFGLQPAAIQTAYDHFKKWQRIVTAGPAAKRRDRPLGAAQFSELQRIWESEQERPEGTAADNWVTAFMLYTPVFIGTSLSRDEQGIWWLLAQRSRDLARVPNAPRPMFMNVLQEPPSETADLWDAAKIFGSSISDRDPNAAWRAMRQWMDEY